MSRRALDVRAEGLAAPTVEMNAAELAATALGTTVLVTPATKSAMRRLRVIDVPSGRSSHATPTFRGGGVAVAAGSLVAVWLSSLALSQKLALAVVAACFGALGLSDDILGISAFRRLVAQFAMGAAFLPLILRALDHAAWAWLISIALLVWLVGFVNVFNFMDGINGIALAQGLVAGATWWGLGLGEHLPSIAVIGGIVAGASLGFAPANFPRASMFLGDVGSYFLGTWLAVGTVLALRSGLRPEAVLGPLTLFIADSVWTLAARVRRGERWYEPHRSHVYQRLVQHGWSHTRTTSFAFAVIVACSALGAVSVTGSTAGRLLADLAAVALLGGYLASPNLVSRRRANLSAVPRS